MRKTLTFTASLMIMVSVMVLPTILNYSANVVHATAAVDGEGNFIEPDSNQTSPVTDSSQTPASPSLQNPLKFGSSICSVLSAILDLVIKIGSLIAVLLIIWSGFLFIKAQGKPAEITNAKKALMWTLIGTAVLLGSSVIANIVVNTVFSVTNQQTGVTICNI